MTKHRLMALTAVAALAGLGVASLGTGCAATRQTRSVEKRGFLGEYSQLRKGKGDEPQLFYIDRQANWSGYHSMMIDSATIWYSGTTASLSDEDAKALTDRLYGALHAQLAKDYKIVQTPGPGVIRLRAAVTQAKGANVVGKTVTTVVPQLNLLTTAAGVASDTQVFVGKATVEAELVDSLTGRRLAAAVDTRAGTKTPGTIGGTWKDVYNAFDHWASSIRKDLAELRAG